MQVQTSIYDDPTPALHFQELHFGSRISLRFGYRNFGEDMKEFRADLKSTAPGIGFLGGVPWKPGHGVIVGRVCDEDARGLLIPSVLVPVCKRSKRTSGSYIPVVNEIYKLYKIYKIYKI